MKTLNGLFPNIVAKYEFVFCLRFDLLLYRAHLVWISDSVRLARYLAGLEDSSNEVQRLASIICDNAIAEALRSVAYSGKSIAAASTAPCLEVELRLIQEMIKQLTKCGVRELSQDSELGEMVGKREINGLVDPDIVVKELDRRDNDGCSVSELDRGLDLGSSFTREQSANSLKTATTLCKEYPNTAGRFLSIVAAPKPQELDRHPPNLPRMYSDATRLREAWGSHVLGQLRTCQKGHPYSGGSFPKGCPECGRKAEVPDVEFARNAKYLHGDKFLEQMTRCGRN
jgi:hypothetical protein